MSSKGKIGLLEFSVIFDAVYFNAVYFFAANIAGLKPGDITALLPRYTPFYRLVQAAQSLRGLAVLASDEEAYLGDEAYPGYLVFREIADGDRTITSSCFYDVDEDELVKDIYASALAAELPIVIIRTTEYQRRYAQHIAVELLYGHGNTYKPRPTLY